MIRTARTCATAARMLVALLLTLAATGAAGAQRVVEGLVNPESVLVGPRGDIYVSQIGEFAKDGDGSVVRVNADGTLEPFATGLNDPKGLAHDGTHLYVTDRNQIWRIDAKGKVTEFVGRTAFPAVPKFLNDIVYDGAGHLYVSDSGAKGVGGAIYKVSSRGKVSLVTNTALDPLVKSPNGLVMDGPNALLVVDFASGELYRISLGTKRKSRKIATGFGGGDGLVLDRQRRLYVSDWKNGHVWRLSLASPTPVPVKYEQTFRAAADMALAPGGRFLIVPDMKAGTLTWLPLKP